VSNPSDTAFDAADGSDSRRLGAVASNIGADALGSDTEGDALASNIQGDALAGNVGDDTIRSNARSDANSGNAERNANSRNASGSVASGLDDANSDYPIAFKAAWSFSRGLTRDLLEDMSESDLLFLPGPQLGAMWKQFRHVGRVQECYMEALITGRIDFSPEGKSYDHGPSKKWLQAYLAGLDDRLYEILANVDWRSEMIWFDEKVKVFEHMMRMVSHETLHHGQWVVYMRLMNKSFPESWSVWGL
jgi:uncharacterized damage-inducible protein DinB